MVLTVTVEIDCIYFFKKKKKPYHNDMFKRSRFHPRITVFTRLNGICASDTERIQYTIAQDTSIVSGVRRVRKTMSYEKEIIIIITRRSSFTADRYCYRKNERKSYKCRFARYNASIYSELVIRMI